VAILGLAFALIVILAFWLGNPPGSATTVATPTPTPTPTPGPGSSPPPAPGDRPAPALDAPLTLEVSADGGLSAAGQPLSPQEWDERVKAELARRGGGGPESVEVVLRVDGRARGKVVNALLRRLKDAGLARVQIALTSGAGTMVEQGR
jgi:biopolymer transport protein ExbD